MADRGMIGPQTNRFSPKVDGKKTPDSKSSKKLDSATTKKDRSKQKTSTKSATGATNLPTTSSKLKPTRGGSSSTNNYPKNKKLLDNKDNSRSAPARFRPPSSPTTTTTTKTRPPSSSPPSSFTSFLPDSKPASNVKTVDRHTRAASDSAVDLHLPQLPDHLLQRLSFDGKDLVDILQGNSLSYIMGSNKKKEPSSQSIYSLNIFQIYKAIASHRQENLSIEPYFTKLKTLWDEIAILSSEFARDCSGTDDDDAIENLSELTERDKVIQFLVGLNDSYATICAQILVKRPFPTVEEAYSEIIREENRRDLAIVFKTLVA